MKNPKKGTILDIKNSDLWQSCAERWNPSSLEGDEPLFPSGIAPTVFVEYLYCVATDMKIHKRDFIEYAGTAVLVAGGLAAVLIGDAAVKKMLFLLLALCMWVLTLFQVLEYRALSKKTVGDLVYTIIFALVALIITAATVYMFIRG